MHNRSIYVWQERFNAIITRSAGFVPLRKAVEFDSLLFMSYYSEDIIFYGKTRTNKAEAEAIVEANKIQIKNF